MAEERSQGDAVATAARALYGAATGAAVAVLAPLSYLVEGRDAAAERLGRRVPPPAAGPRIVVHGVSAGEMGAAGALLPALEARLRGVSFVLTTGTAAGRVVAERLRAERPSIGAVRFLPWDRRRAVERWLDALSPAAVVVVETELWPNLFLGCRDRGTPLVVASARLYPRDVSRYRLVRRLFRQVLGAAAWIGAQDAGERAALLSIGAPPERVDVAGNLKLDALPPDRPLPEPWDVALLAVRPLVVAGSTHAPEEGWLAEAVLRLRDEVPGLGLVVAPRHVGRARRVHRALASRGLRTALLSAAPPEAGWDALVVDAYGWLASLYRHASVAFAGGSLVPRGGQSPFEAAAAGCPVLSGPHTGSFPWAYAGLRAAGGAFVVEAAHPVPALVGALRPLLVSPPARDAAGAAGRSFVAAHGGAARRTADAIVAALASGAPAQLTP